MHVSSSNEIEGCDDNTELDQCYEGSSESLVEDGISNGYNKLKKEYYGEYHQFLFKEINFFKQHNDNLIKLLKSIRKGKELPPYEKSEDYGGRDQTVPEELVETERTRVEQAKSILLRDSLSKSINNCLINHRFMFKYFNLAIEI